jgi:predicted enzyme related to lactoylglutathione lyase
VQVDSFIINMTSENPESMVAFYRGTLELPPAEAGEGSFKVGGATLIVDGHSRTSGPSKEPHRFLVDFVVADLAAEKARLESAGVQFIREPQREHWGGLITTFLDPDGNYLQLIEMPKE